MVMYGWFTLGGTEIANSNRVAAYANTGITAGCTCPDLEASLGHEPYTDPVSDHAPWYDPAAPQSKDFHGVLGLEINGAAASTLSSEWSELINDGGVAGAPRRASRELEFKVMLLAASEDALSYGLEWLASILDGSECRSGCIGDTLCLYSGCPTPPLPDGNSCDPTNEPDPEPPPPWDPVEAGDRNLRQLFDVSLLEYADDPEFSRLTGNTWTATITFTLKAGRPQFHHHPVTIIDSTNDDLNPPYRDRIEDYSPYWEPECPPLRDCLDSNPYCGNDGPWGPEPFPGSNPRDPILVDPCYPTTGFTAQRAIYSDHHPGVPRVPRHLEKVPLIEVYTGSRALRRTTIRWYSNTNRHPPGPNLDPCDICNEITIPHIPAWTRVVLDGRTKRVTVECDVNEQTGRQRGYQGQSDVTLYGPYGQHLDWPAFNCGQAMLIELLCQAGTLAPDARYRLDWVVRGDAA